MLPSFEGTTSNVAVGAAWWRGAHQLSTCLQLGQFVSCLLKCSEGREGKAGGSRRHF